MTWLVEEGRHKDMKNLLIELINVFEKMNNRDCLDYIAMFTPILLSLVAIFISLWDSVWSFKTKKIDAFMIWDNLRSSHFIIIRNACKRTLIIKSVSLFAYDKRNKELYELGTRDNVWANHNQSTYISQGEAIKIIPEYGSEFDVFAYKGHGFDVIPQNRDLFISMKIVDIDGKTWKVKTNFTLGQIDDSLAHATNAE